MRLARSTVVPVSAPARTDTPPPRGFFRLTRARVLAQRGAAGQIPPAVWVALLCLVVVVVVDAVIRHEAGIHGDEPSYVQMAAHPLRAHKFPYAYRIAIPWLVHVLPFAHSTSFKILAWLVISASAGVLYTLLRDFEVPPWLAASLALGFALSPTYLAVLVRGGRDIDPASVLVLMLGCLFIVRRRLVALSITLLIGVAVRESTLFLIPLAYAVWAERPLDRQALRDVALVGLVPAGVYIALRISIDTFGRRTVPGYASSFFTNRWNIVKVALGGGSAGIEARRLAYTFGPLWLVAPFALRDLRFARRGLVLVVLCLAGMTFAYDWGRIIFLAAPVVYVAAGHVIRNRRWLAAAVVIALLAVDIGYGIYLQVYGVKHGIDSGLPQLVNGE
jgi:hypothetical protein